MDETGTGQAPDPCIHENDGAAPCGRIFSTFDAGIGPRACFAVSISVQQNFFPHFWPSCAFAQIKIGALQSSILQRSYFLFVRGSALGGLLSAALQEGLGAGPWARCQIYCPSFPEGAAARRSRCMDLPIPAVCFPTWPLSGGSCAPPAPRSGGGRGPDRRCGDGQSPASPGRALI